MEVRAYGQDKGRTYCSQEEFMDECKKYMEVGDTIVTETHDEGEVLAFRNSAKCLLAMWIVDTNEYRSF